MTRKILGAAGALLVLCGLLIALAGSAIPAIPSGREALRAAYRRPDAIPFPDHNPYSAAKASLGRALFFDPILSGSRTRACASCHMPARSWSDGRTRAAALGQGELAWHTPTLIDIAWIDRLGWDGKFRDLESVAFKPITAATIMNLPEEEAIARLSASPDYAKAFAEAFPDPSEGGAAQARPVVTRERIEQALATFERMLVAQTAPFDRWIAGDEGAIAPAAKRGFDLFNGRARCAACHTGSSFSDGSFHDIGTAFGEDVGRGRFFPDSRALLHAFKTPTLRDVARRAPYMHDGSIATLSAVIELYDRGGVARPSRSRDMRPLNLSAQEKADLLAFLETLSAGPGEQRALARFADAPYRP